jgi:hypothetical protein
VCRHVPLWRASTPNDHTTGWCLRPEHTCVCLLCVCVDLLLCQALNLILLTAGEVRGLRESLRDVSASEVGQTNFNALYPCWSHSAGG